MQHYRNHKINPIDVIVEYQFCFRLGNVIKYVLRHRYKGGRNDLMKAVWYLVHYLTGNSGLSSTIVKLVEDQPVPVCNDPAGYYTDNINDIVHDAVRRWGKVFYSKLCAENIREGLPTIVWNTMLFESGINHTKYASMAFDLLEKAFEQVDWDMVAATIEHEMERENERESEGPEQCD
jgi:Protein of unknwon function (DUF3310)